MAYEPTIWKKGDVVTSEKLNNLEDGVAAANKFSVGVIDIGIVVDGETGDSTIIIDETYEELLAAYSSGTKIIGAITSPYEDLLAPMKIYQDSQSDEWILYWPIYSPEGQRIDIRYYSDGSKAIVPIG